MKKVVFPDTNVFLHFRPLDEVDLPALLDCTEVELVITPVVLEELDEHKWAHSLPKIRKRADSSLKRIEAWVEDGTPIRSGVTVTLHASEPKDETLEAHRLNWRSQDDRLFATILEYQEEQRDEDILLLAGDSGARLRIRNFGIATAQLPDDVKLPSAQDALQKINQELRQELATLRNRMPLLELRFAGELDGQTVELERQLTSAPSEMSDLFHEMVGEVKRKAALYLGDETPSEHLGPLDPLADIRKQVGKQISAMANQSFVTPSQEEIERYRREVAAFPEKFDRYLRRHLSIANEHRRTIRIALELENSGGAPAEDVLLILTVPEKLQWRWEPEDSDFPDPPEPPRTPRTLAQTLAGDFNALSVPARFRDMPYMYMHDDLDLLSPIISESGLRLKWEIGSCRHHQAMTLDPLFVMFRDPEDISNFGIQYEVHEKNTPERVTGRLLVKAVQK